MNAREDVFLSLRINGWTLHHDAAERGLDVTAGTSETVIQVHVAEGGIKIVLKQPMHHATSDPDAFRIAGRAGHLLCDFGQIVQPLRFLLCLLGGLLLRLVGRLVLGDGRCGADADGETEERQGSRETERHDGEFLWRVRVMAVG